MNILKAIFAGPGTVNKVIDAGLKGIDSAYFTDQEKSAWFLKYLESTQPQNLARRVIAFGIVGLWMLLVLLAVILGLIFGIDDGSKSMFVFKVVDDLVQIPFLGIMAFYFATHLLRSKGK